MARHGSAEEGGEALEICGCCRPSLLRIMRQAGVDWSWCL